ncbi:serine hydrolase domain-containing protein [Sphingomonas sp. BAUL-RG-20F-R05-02]|uniref:serine hydrolase domain-containing protein n=1 Tax=Sphingomonas sp. BAUL-RG-20F-R05-02 TaxID=2914830 RepID=UPI001F575518|nr:serine hydrolase domain-containing protein [Sphingomonas sp. BAUL-RG-20F-R05-02]
MKISLPLATALLALATPVYAQNLTPSEAAKVDAIVTQSLARTGVPSASIAIVRGGNTVFAKAYGKQSETIPQARADLKYPIASISKQFTAAAMLLLEDEGKLSLDDHVSKYVPGVSDGDVITIRQLLSHTSGLQDYWPQDYSFAAMRNPVTPQQILDRWAKKPLDFTPGTKWQYSNTGYVVAGLIVEKVAGMPLLDFLKLHVFTPLGMDPVDQDKANGPGYPQGYQRFALGPVRPERPAAPGWLFAAGELAMSASDLAKWDIARMNRTLLPAEDWITQETPVKLADGTTNGYGLGVSAHEQAGHAYIEHSGEAVGFLSENTVFPDDKAAVVVLVNADFSGAFTDIAGKIADVILPPSQAQRAEVANTAKALRLYEMLRMGTLDRNTMTDDSNYYFTPTALADYKATLGPLGEPKSFELAQPPKLRGGFVNRNYRAVFADRTLNIATYAEPGDTGRYEQFLVMPSQ